MFSLKNKTAVGVPGGGFAHIQGLNIT